MVAEVWRFISQRRMSVFKMSISPVSGRQEWVEAGEDYDFYQEIARSTYADMLHDWERNKKYREAIEKVVGEVKSAGEKANVLDIGTGTGLLAMLASRAGADSVTACEAFYPIGQAAKKVTKLNGHERIKIVEKRSTELNPEDIGYEPNILLAEVFDTELIGEGALRTYKDAHERYLSKKVRAIPAKAKVWVLPIESEDIRRWEKPETIRLPEYGIDIRPPQSVCACSGTASVQDLQADEIPLNSFTPISDPLMIFEFDFENGASINYDESKVSNVMAKDSEKEFSVTSLIFWWDLDMDGSGTNILSTEPSWISGKKKPWRDHWMQAIYHLPTPIKGKEKFELLCAHDEYSFWFGGPTEISARDPRPVCQCGFHLINSRSNTLRLNDNEVYRNLVPELIKVCAGKNIVYVGSFSYLPLLAVQLGATHVFVVSDSELSGNFRKILEFADESGIDRSKLSYISSESLLAGDNTIDLILGDPHLHHSVLPWHNLHFWYQASNLKSAFPSAKVLPSEGSLKCLPVDFVDLWKIRAPVGEIEGFDIKPFDDMTQKAISMTDSLVEPHALWEYPSSAVGKVKNIMCFDLTSGIPTKALNRNIELEINPKNNMNGLALWMEWTYGDCTVSTGLRRTSQIGGKPDWIPYERQGVILIPKVPSKREIQIQTVFEPATGDINFSIY